MSKKKKMKQAKVVADRISVVVKNRNSIQGTNLVHKEQVYHELLKSAAK
jgi:hypothetical protein